MSAGTIDPKYCKSDYVLALRANAESLVRRLMDDYAAEGPLAQTAAVAQLLDATAAQLEALVMAGDPIIEWYAAANLCESGAVLRSILAYEEAP